MKTIYKANVYDYTTSTYNANGEVKTVYGINGFGDLMPVEFYQVEKFKFQLKYSNCSDIFVKYK